MVIQKTAKITKSHFKEANKAASLLLENLDGSLIYHRKKHTVDFVIPAALKIAEMEGFSPEEKFLVGIAAAFHDTGFAKKYNANESVGAKLAEGYMRSSALGYSEKHIKIVKNAIKNTNMKNPPKTKFEKVLRDADLSYFGDKYKFFKLIIDLENEAKIHLKSPLHKASENDKDWMKSSLKFMQSHKWFTEGAKSMFEKNKQKNIELLKSKLG